MKSRPLKVGEYRKVKTWEQLLATEGAKVDKSDGSIQAPSEYEGVWFFKEEKHLCGEVVKINKTFKDGTSIVAGSLEEFIAEFFTNDYYDENGNEIEMEHTWVDDINPLDQLELEANLTLAKIAKLREIEAKQAEIDTKIEEQNKRIEEYEKGEL